MARRLDFEAEYNNRARVPDHPEIQGRWSTRSRAFREQAGTHALLDQAYGDLERQKFDLFQPADGAADAPLIVFIHGGYWQRGDRTDYACVAEVFTNAGFRVALPSYRLCPDVAVAHIVGDIQEFLVALFDQIPRRPLVVGHSAGGHLAAMALATDWSDVDGVPNDLVTHAIAISGLFDLQPLLKVSANDVLCLTPETAHAVSPLSGSAPGGDRHLVAAVGADESAEFIRQSLEIAGRWGQDGLTTECMLVPAANHFTVLDELMRPGSGLHRRVVDLAHAVSAEVATALVSTDNAAAAEAATDQAAHDDAPAAQEPEPADLQAHEDARDDADAPVAEPAAQDADDVPTGGDEASAADIAAGSDGPDGDNATV